MLPGYKRNILTLLIRFMFYVYDVHKPRIARDCALGQNVLSQLEGPGEQKWGRGEFTPPPRRREGAGGQTGVPLHIPLGRAPDKSGHK